MKNHRIILSRFDTFCEQQERRLKVKLEQTQERYRGKLRKAYREQELRIREVGTTELDLIEVRDRNGETQRLHKEREGLVD